MNCRTTSFILLCFFMTILTASAFPLISIRQETDTETSPVPSVEPTTETPSESVSPAVGTTDTTTDGVDETPDESPAETSDEPVCVDEQYLLSKGHTLDTMVHKQATLVNAFCPSGSLPCGTAHHMIRTSDGSKLSYRQLCEQENVECQRRMIKVNSVLSHRWIEESHDNGIKLTMFDVRHPETVQKVVHAAIHASRRVFG